MKDDAYKRFSIGDLKRTMSNVVKQLQLDLTKLPALTPSAKSLFLGRRVKLVHLL